MELQETKTREVDKTFANSKIPGWAYRIARSKYSIPAFGVCSFLEAFFLPMIPDTVGMLLSALRTKEWVKITIVGVTTSVLGGVVGYFLGYTIFNHLVELGIIDTSTELFQSMYHYFLMSTFWTIFIAAFTPLPYKVFTIASGFFHISFPVFIIASVLGRSSRYAIENYLAAKYGETVINKIIHITNKTTKIILIAILLILFLVYYFWI